MNLDDCLALWKEFKVNSAIEFEESDKHYLHSWFRYVNSVWTVYAVKIFDFSYFLPMSLRQHRTSVTCILS
jgi:hypothetical protein